MDTVADSQSPTGTQWLHTGTHWLPTGYTLAHTAYTVGLWGRRGAHWSVVISAATRPVKAAREASVSAPATRGPQSPGLTLHLGHGHKGLARPPMMCVIDNDVNIDIDISIAKHVEYQQDLLSER